MNQFLDYCVYFIKNLGPVLSGDNIYTTALAQALGTRFLKRKQFIVSALQSAGVDAIITIYPDTEAKDKSIHAKQVTSNTVLHYYPSLKFSSVCMCHQQPRFQTKIDP